MTSLLNKLYDINHSIIITIDGLAASGKGTISALLAKRFTLKYFESGFIYRNLAYHCMINQIDATDHQQIIDIAQNIDFPLSKDSLSSEEVGNFASTISPIAEVRNIINEKLKKLVNINPRVIFDGRDMGTVVFPQADLKLFITADLLKRAERRFNQLRNEGKLAIMPEILEKLQERDTRDQTRALAPLKVAKGAFVIDTSNLTPEMVVSEIEVYIKSLQ